MHRKFFGKREFLAIFSQKIHDDMSLSGEGGNRKNFCEKFLGVPVVSAEQVHGNRIQVIDSDWPVEKLVPKTDALVTKMKGVGLAMGMADCFSVVLIDPISEVLANIHAGRQGVILGIVPETVAVMEKLGSRNWDIRVLIGPGICAECYEVEREKALRWGFQSYSEYMTPVSGKPDKCHIDLSGIIKYQLIEEAGIKRRHIELKKICTFEDRNYFSYRRALVKGDAVGEREENPSQRGVCVAVMKDIG